MRPKRRIIRRGSTIVTQIVMDRQLSNQFGEEAKAQGMDKSSYLLMLVNAAKKSVAIPDELNARLDAVARRLGKPRHECAEMLIRHGIESWEHRLK